MNQPGQPREYNRLIIVERGSFLSSSLLLARIVP